MRLTDLQTTYKKTAELITIIENKQYPKGLADCYKIMGYCLWRFSNYPESLYYSSLALEIYKKIGDIKNEADTLNNIGAVYMFQNEHQKRLEVNIKCKQLRQVVGDFEGVSSSEGNIGETYMEMRDYLNATKCFNNVLSDKNSSPQGLAWAYHNLGKIDQITNNLKGALKNFTKGLQISLSVSYNVLITDSYIEIAKVHIENKHYEKALINALKGLEVSKKIGAKEGERDALKYVAIIYEKLQDYKNAYEYHKQFNFIDHNINKEAEIERLKSTQLQVAFNKIEEQKKEIVDSIKYAKRIQKAVLKREQKQDLLQNYFVFFEPKDIVSGDFYWYFEKDNFYYLCVADCTGHGVPGAFLTMLGTSFLNEIISINNNLLPAEILTELRQKFIHALNQSQNSMNKDGMDISLVKFDTTNQLLSWAGANNPIVIIRDKKYGRLETSSKLKIIENDTHLLYEIKPDKQPISISRHLLPFTNHTIKLNKNDRYYLFSDGYVDQFGGKFEKKYLSINFKKLLLKIQNEDMFSQKRLIKKSFFDWKNQLEQIDDVCVIGVSL
jgi:serine phosphatase RsbU (regulator of sigma subunit)